MFNKLSILSGFVSRVPDPTMCRMNFTFGLANMHFLNTMLDYVYAFALRMRPNVSNAHSYRQNALPCHQHSVLQSYSWSVKPYLSPLQKFYQNLPYQMEFE